MNRTLFIYYAMPLLVLIAALLQSTVAALIVIRGVKPDLVLILVLTATLVYGGRSGIAWAFIGGIGLDLFSGGPMGASSLALMAATAVASLGYRVLSRYNLWVPIGVSVVGTLLYGAVYVGILTFLREAAQLPVLAGLAIPVHQIPWWETLQNVIVPALFYNTTIVIFLAPLLNRVPEHQEGF
ncbi:MAG: rod shape-determining protein MreD [Caldilineaceae bacterium]